MRYVGVVTDNPPTPQEARAALAEASSQAARVRQADRQFRWILLSIAAIYLVVAGVMSATPWRRGGTTPGLAVLVIVIVGLAGTILLITRLRAYSRAGVVWFIVAAAAFTWWNAIVSFVSIATGWWGPQQPSYHFGVSVMVGVIPLVVAAWLIGRR
jgi:hypothetical protein